MKMGSKGRDIHGHPLLSLERQPHLAVPLWEKVDMVQWQGKGRYPERKGEEREERQKEHNEESRMQFPVSHSFSLLSSMLSACIRRVVANKQWGHFTAMDRVLSRLRACPSTLFLSINPENRMSQP